MSGNKEEDADVDWSDEDIYLNINYNEDNHAIVKVQKESEHESHKIEAINDMQNTNKHETVADNDMKTTNEHETVPNNDVQNANEHETVANNDMQNTNEHEISTNNDVQNATERKTEASNDMRNANEHETETSNDMQNANDHETAANNVVQNANEHATDASNDVQNANAHATEASNDVQNVNAHATEASNEVQNANAHATEASNDVQNANAHATDASNEVQNANAHATEASNDVQNVNAHATEASNDMQNANEHEIEANTDVQNANGHATDASNDVQNANAHATDASDDVQNDNEHATDASNYVQNANAHATEASNDMQNANAHATEASNDVQNVNAHAPEASNDMQNANEHEIVANNDVQNANEHATDASNDVQNANAHATEASNDMQNAYEHAIDASNDVQNANAHATEASNDMQNANEHKIEANNDMQNVNERKLEPSYDMQNKNKHVTQANNGVQKGNENTIEASNDVQKDIELETETSNNLLIANEHETEDINHMHKANERELEVSLNYTSSSDDCLPLSKLREQRLKNVEKKQVRRKLIEIDTGFSDDSDQDKSYDPERDSFNSTDSETEEYQEMKQRKRKHVVSCRNKSWKKKASTFKTKLKKSTNKQHSPLRDKMRRSVKLLNDRRKKTRSLELNDAHKAMRRSKALASLKAQANRLHSDRLDQLLAANERKRFPIAADGNCFFAAVAESMDNDLYKDVDAFRNIICDHIQQNKETYMPFITKISEDENHDESDAFDKEITIMRQRGHWDASLADCMPLAVANKLNCLVRIYSSSISTPIINIKPSTWKEGGCYTNVEIAYVAIRKNEHYDATKPVTIHSNNIQLPLEHTTPYGDRETIREKVLESEKRITVTPHKRADYESPKKKLSTRKRKRNASEWQSSVRKRKRLEGKPYKSKSGKPVEGKRVKRWDCSKCKFKCSSNFTETDRQNIFDMYYALPTYEQQRCFLCDVVSKGDPVRQSKGSRKVSLKYHLSNGEENKRVCKNFFLKTLDIGEKMIRYTIKRKINGTFQGTDMRGRHTPSTKIDNETVKKVYDHINSFPRMESHYSRKGSKKQYLAHDLNIKIMWQLYKDWCNSKGHAAVKESKYRQIFCENFNLSFYKPKKDQCSVCAKYIRYRSASTVSTEIQNGYEIHQQKKVEARSEKAKDKEKAKKDRTYCVATFDLQAVLTTPCSLVSELYYSRKLCCYNLTVYNLADKQVLCHVWDETHGKRGSCEIATCLLKSTESFCRSGATEVTYYSDTCGGQNRNRFVASSYVYSIAKLPKLRAINHKFLQSGHSQMECDAVHSTIEQAKKRTSIHVPSQWSTVINMARKSNPYVTVPLKFGHVLDFKAFVSKYKINLQKTTDGKNIKWLNVRWIRVAQENPTHILFNYTFDEQEFQTVEIQQISTRNKGRPKNLPNNDSEMEMCYSSRLEISVQKKSDLVKLCTKDIIPEEYHSYFANLPTSKSHKDFIPENSDFEDDE